MSATGGPGPGRAVAALVSYSVRATLPGRRALLVLPSVGALLFAVLARTSDEPAATAFALVAGTAMHFLILPIVCLVVGDAVLGAEIRSGVFAFTWLSPVPLGLIALGRWIGAMALAVGMLAPAALLGAWVAAPGSAFAALVAVVAGSAGYLGLFVAIGAATRRPVVWSLALVLIVERLLGAGLSAIAQLSPAWLAQAALVGISGATGDFTRRGGVPLGGAAVGRLALVTAAALALATWRLRHLKTNAAAD